MTRINDFQKKYSPKSRPWKGKVTFGFSYPSHGWILLAVTCNTFVQGVIVSCSYAFDPFPELFRWLGDIIDGNLPSEFFIEEELEPKNFRAKPLNRNEFIFEIVDGFWDEDESGEEPIFLYARVEKKQFLSEFIKRWEDFIENYYDPSHWELHGSNLRKLDFSRLKPT